MISRRVGIGRFPLLAYFLCLMFCWSQATTRPPKESTSPVTIRLNNGMIQGVQLTTANGGLGNVFLGVPYASPPVGKLRFVKPQPPQTWKGVLPCTEFRKPCWQNHTAMDQQHHDGVEDCLYLNVFGGVKCNVIDPCPVIFYVHGGGYNGDTPSQFNTGMLVDNFANRDTIIITVAFRMGPFAFWTTSSDAAPGNYAMHDMIAALNWIQNEISAFGGDSSKVTLMGHSSGAGAVSLLSLSPRTSGLFNQVIIMSGSSTAGSMGLQNDDDIYWKLSEAFGCARTGQKNDPQSHVAVLDCMREVPADMLGMAFKELQGILGYVLGPRNDGIDGLYPRPYDQLLNERRPLTAMLGTTVRESIYDNRTTAMDVTKECERSFVASPNQELLTRECQRLYTPSRIDRPSLDLSNDSIWPSQILSLTGDRDYHGPVFLEAASLRARGAMVYLYSFNFSRTGFEQSTPFHSFDLVYVNGLHPFPFDDRDRQMQRVYSRLFANFAKGHPTPPIAHDPAEVWRPLDWPYGFNYYSIELPQPRMKSPFHFDGVLFWDYVVPSIRGSTPSVWGRPGQKSPKAVRADDNDGVANNGAYLIAYQISPPGAVSFWVLLLALFLGFGVLVAVITYLILKRNQYRSVYGQSLQQNVIDGGEVKSYNTFA